MERYTPDGTLGRLLMGLGGGGVSLYTGVYGLATLFGTTSLGGLIALVFGSVFAVGGAVGLFVALLTLWPVYLSLIGNVDRPAAYGTRNDASTRSVAETSGSPTADGDDPVATLERRYTAGEITHEEFERRLDRLVDASGDVDRDEDREVGRLRE